jgi:hypothetical protein
MKSSKAFLSIILFVSSLLFNYCNSEQAPTKRSLDQYILSDTSNYFYVDLNNYPLKNKKLPIGIFDSGTG